MKILFVLKQRNYLQTYTGVIQALSARGHHVRLAWPDEDVSLPAEMAQRGVSIQSWEPKRADEWSPVVNIVRRAGDYLRYLDAGYRDAVKLRARAFDKLLHSVSRGVRSAEAGWSEAGLSLTDAERARLTSLFALVEQAVPSDARQEAFIEADRPDVVLVSPLIDLGSAQADVVKSAKRLGIPTGMVLFSWDNLSTKGGLHVAPDAMFVWNDRQRQEAATLHGYPIERTVATGAPRFDEFFRLSPSTDRAAFYEPLRLDPRRPTIMYVGSSKFIMAESELPFIRDWVRQLRASTDPLLRTCNVVIRPHPDVKEWEDEGSSEIVRWKQLEGKGEVTRPIDDPSVVVLRTHYRKAQAFYDALYHSAAVVGLNTSAALEAAIVGRPVFTILADRAVADGQASTLHFHYLLEENGGCVALARDFEEHRTQLTAALTAREQNDRLRVFARDFVRPHGLDRPASEMLASAIESWFEARAGGGAHAPAPEEQLGEPEDAATTVQLDFPQRTILLRVSSQPERRWRAHACAKEPWTVDWLIGEVRRGEVLYDIGANVGTFSLIAAVHCGAMVVAFEPGYANFARLCENIHLNGCDRAIVPVPLPLSDTTGLAGFKYRSLDPGQSRHHLGDRRWTSGGVTEAPAGRYTQPVCMMPLDSVVDAFGLALPTHIKLDVDGAEMRVLGGAARVLRGKSLRTILIESDPQLWDSVGDVLRGHGFRLREQFKRDHKPTAPLYAMFARE